MTQKEIVLNYIKERGSITLGEAFYKCGVGCLAERIRDLKKDGHKFRTEPFSFICRRTGHKGTGTRYFLL